MVHDYSIYMYMLLQVQRVLHLSALLKLYSRPRRIHTFNSGMHIYQSYGSPKMCQTVIDMQMFHFWHKNIILSVNTSTLHMYNVMQGYAKG